MKKLDMISDSIKISDFLDDIFNIVKRLSNDKDFYDLIFKYMREGYNPETLDKLVNIIYVGVDKEHHAEHIKDVTTRGLNMIETLNLNVSKEDIILYLLAALFHDVGNAIDREKHHIISSMIFRELYLVPAASTNIVMSAISCHRASSEVDANSTIGLVLSAADRGSPYDIDKIILRVYNYAATENPENTLMRNCIDTLIFIINKYSREGYARKNSIYELYYKEYTENQYKKIDNLNINYIAKIVLDESLKDVRRFNVE